MGILNSIIIKGSAKIGNSAFAESHITKVEIKAKEESILETIPESVFANCTSLNDVQLEEGIKYINKEAFLGCSWLQEISFPSSLIDIQEKAFYSCWNLDNIIFPVDTKIKHIGKETFNDINSHSDAFFWLGGIKYIKEGGDADEESIQKMRIAINGTNRYNITLTNKTFLLADDAFSGVDNIKSIVYKGDKQDWEKVKKGTLGASLDDKEWFYYDEATFYGGSKNLSYSSFHPGVDDGLCCCEKGTAQGDIIIPPVDPSSLDRVIALTNFGGDSVQEPEENIFSVKMADTVESLQSSSFYYCANLSSIKLSSKIKTIGEQSFWHCSSLQEFFLPASLERLQPRVFTDCPSLQKIKFDTNNVNQVVIGEECFHNCVALEEVILPFNVKEIKYDTFQGCSNLRKINLPQNLLTIGAEAFQNCYLLEDVTIPKTLETIGVSAFENSGIKNITIPNTVQSIEANTFRNCKNLKYCNLNGQNIKSSAFSGCQELRYLSCNLIDFDNDISSENFVFEGCYSLKTVFCENIITETIYFDDFFLGDFICKVTNGYNNDRILSRNDYTSYKIAYDSIISSILQALEKDSTGVLPKTYTLHNVKENSNQFLKFINRKIGQQVIFEDHSPDPWIHPLIEDNFLPIYYRDVDEYYFYYSPPGGGGPEIDYPKLFIDTHNKNPYNFYDYYVFKRVDNMVNNQIKTNFNLPNTLDINKLSDVLNKADDAYETIIINQLFGYDRINKEDYEDYNNQYVYFDPSAGKWVFNLNSSNNFGFQLSPIKQFEELHNKLQDNYPTKKTINLALQKINELKEARIDWDNEKQILDKSAYYKWLEDRKDYTFKDGNGIDYVYDDRNDFYGDIYIDRYKLTLDDENGVAATKV